MKILIIDQDPTVLEMLQISLMRSGHQVSFAADGNAGLRLAQAQKPDLIVMDILLPGIDGVELCQQIKHAPETKDIPILIITATVIPAQNEPWRPTPDSAWQLLNYDAYVPKPLDINQFLRTAESILESNKTLKRPTGPSVTLIIQDDAIREAIQQTLKEEDYYVKTYASLIKPISAMRALPPAALVIDHDFIDQTGWKALAEIKSRTPTFGLILLQQQPNAMPPMPENQSLIDVYISYPPQPWQVVNNLKQLLAYLNYKARIDILSAQLMLLNGNLVESKQVLLAQNEELDLANRRMHRLGELKETLTGMIVHDLKAPLSAMLGAMQFMTMDPNNTISETSQRILSGGLAAGRQMQRLTETLLDEQKLENNQLVFDIEPLKLTEILASSLEVMNPLLNMHKLEMNTQIPEDLPEILADPMILQRIIENLLDNAVKYTPANETISIIAVPKDDMVEICIADRGDGIPPEHRDLVFDRFTQLENLNSVNVRGGVGLGLAFCKLAVETMGGKIWVGSHNNIGAAFYFTLPAATQRA